MKDDYEAPGLARALQIVVRRFNTGTVTRKTFFKRMAALGYQQAEALKLAENWDDE